MKANRIVVLSAVCAAAMGAAASSPQITAASVDAKTGASRPNKTVTYTLSGEPGIVTFYLMTNGVPVDCPYVHVSGDVNRLLQPGEHSFSWQSDLDWPGHEIRTETARIVVKAWSTNAPPDYMIVPLTRASTESPKYYAKAADIPDGITNIAYKTDYLAMRLIHARGTFARLGQSAKDYGYNADDYARNSARLVAFTNDYYIGVYPITRFQYDVMGCNRKMSEAFNFDDELKQRYLEDNDYAKSRPCVGPSPFYFLIAYNGSDYDWPTVGGYGADSRCFFGKLRSKTGNQSFFLPSEAQWENACRAGTTTLFSNGSSTDMTDIGWCVDNNADDPDWVEGLPHAVGLKKPNAWGLYDMNGSIHEYVLDRWRTSMPASVAHADGTPIFDPKFANPNWDHMSCGGSFKDSQAKCASGYIRETGWSTRGIDLGFRVTCSAVVFK